MEECSRQDRSMIPFGLTSYKGKRGGREDEDQKKIIKCNYVPHGTQCKLGVGLMVRAVGLGSYSPEFKSCCSVELIPGEVDSACHPSEVGKMSTSLLE